MDRMYFSITAAAFFIAAQVSAPTVDAQQVVPKNNGLPGGVAGAVRVPLEYSNLSDEEAIVGGGAHDGADPLQVLYTEPLDLLGAPFPNDSIDFGVVGDVDGLANIGDAYFCSLVANSDDLLISVKGEATPPGESVFLEGANGATTLLWTHSVLSNPGAPGDLDDLDAMELWGPTWPAAPFGLPGWDANMYSVAGDTGGFSVYIFRLAGVVGYIPQATIAAAVSDVALTDAARGALPFAGPPGAVDLDALMVFDRGGLFDGVWNAGDTIVFSIRAAANWDGGEIVVLRFGEPPEYLFHGGHPWDTPFLVGAALGVGTEEVDGIEAFGADQSFGACCMDVPNVACVNLTAADCGCVGGIFRGDGTNCAALDVCNIPAVSEWGMIAMVLLVLTAATVIMSRRRAFLEGHPMT
jgi:hypothetical protein